MAEQAQETKFSSSMLHPVVLSRLARGWLRSRIGRRPMLPRDIWHPRGITTGGTDTVIYKDDILHYWGQVPYELYVSTEVILMALQAWNRRWMTFIPEVAFWEFIPEEELSKNKEDEGYQPATVLLDEVEVGKNYEVVLTHLYGMPLLRYRMGDLVTVVALRDEETGVNLPQIVFKTRVSDVIDLAGLTQLDEKTIWQAITNTGVRYEEWSAVKEYDQNQTYLHLYLELKEDREAKEMERLVDEQLKVLDVDYRDLDTWLKLQPVRVTLLSRGTFQRYYEVKRSDGTDLAHLKPPHMNTSDAVIQQLLQLSE